MSLESTLNKLVAAIEANTAAIVAANETMSPAPVSTTAEPPKPSSVSAEPAPETPPRPKPEPKPEPEAPAATVDKKALAAKVIELAKAKGRDAAAALLAEFGATKVPEVKDEDYGAVFAKADELLS